MKNEIISKQLENKTALITGASRGIGKAIAQQLSSYGVNLALVARNEQQLQNVSRDLETDDNNLKKCHIVVISTVFDEAFHVWCNGFEYIKKEEIDDILKKLNFRVSSTPYDNLREIEGKTLLDKKLFPLPKPEDIIKP